MLTGKNVLVTGGAAGIASSIALTLAGHGANIVVADLNLEEARKTASGIDKLGVRCAATKVDISDVKNHRALVTRLEQDFGPIGILVNNAGVNSTTKLPEIPGTCP